jgi:hypothetical protein
MREEDNSKGIRSITASLNTKLIRKNQKPTLFHNFITFFCELKETATLSKVSRKPNLLIIT